MALPSRWENCILEATDTAPQWPRACVYTVLTGDYEALNEQPALKASRLPCYCLTDNPELTSESWEIRPFSPLLPFDPVRSQRDAKIQPRHYLPPDVDISIYIDNSVILKQPPEALLSAMHRPGQSVFFAHSYRNALSEEFLEVMRDGLDDSSRIFEQFNHYKATDPGLLDDPVIWTGFMIRDHTAPGFDSFSRTWAAHVMRYARRDQLSVNQALRQSQTPYALEALDNFDSPWHTWPVTPQRNARRRGSSGSLFEGEFQIEAIRLQQELDQLRQQHAAVQEQLGHANNIAEAHLANYHKLLEEHQSLAQDHRAAAEAHHAAIDSIQNSLSWRLTRPLRWLKQ